jgi:hypothetical protein
LDGIVDGGIIANGKINGGVSTEFEGVIDSGGFSDSGHTAGGTGGHRPAGKGGGNSAQHGDIVNNSKRWYCDGSSRRLRLFSSLSLLAATP